MNSFLRVAITPYTSFTSRSFSLWLHQAIRKQPTHLLIRLPEANKEILGISLASGIPVWLHSGLFGEKIPEGISGVHFNASTLSLRKKIPGNLLQTYSAHSLKEIRTLNFDYYFLSPVFPTLSHPHQNPLGTEILQEAPYKEKIIALGGIVTDERIKKCEAAGIGGFASIRYFLG